MKRLVVSGLAIFALAVTLSACGGSETAEDLSVVKSAPKATGDVDTVTWDLPTGEPVSLDPAMAYNTSESQVVANMCESLYKLDENMQAVPNLATGMTESNPHTLVYAIRQGVKFWNGKEMTASDVAASLKHNLDPAISFYAPFFGLNFISAEATGRYEVTVKMRRRDITFEQGMVTQMGAVSEAAALRREGSKYGTAQGDLMCTGPFEYERWQPGSEIVMTKNPGYWNKALQPRVGQFKFKFITSPTALSNALSSGAIDGSYSIPYSLVSTLDQAASGTLYAGESTEIWALLTNSLADQPGPLQNQQVRTALSLAIDRDAIASTIFAGVGKPIRSVAPEATWGYAKGTWKQAYQQLPADSEDLARAKEIVEKAQFNDRPIELLARAGDSTTIRTCEVLGQAAKELGLQAKIVTVPPQEYNTIVFDPDRRARIDGFVYPGWSEGREPLQALYTAYYTKGGNNFSGYSNPKVDSLLVASNEARDPEKRAQLATQAEAIFSPEFPIVPLVTTSTLSFAADGITGAPVTFVYLWSPWAASVGAGA